MLNWLTERAYNRFDPLWFMWGALAWHDRHYFASVVAIAGGCIVSAALEQWNKARPTPEAGLGARINARFKAIHEEHGDG